MTALGSIVSTLGGGSGIDMGKLASDLATAQFAPRQSRLEARTALLQERISAAGTIRNALRTLATSLGDRVRSGDLAPRAQVSNPAVATAAVSGTAPGTGPFSLEVLALAQGQVLTSPAFADKAAPLGGGTLRLRFGTLDAGNFSPSLERPPVEIALAPDANLDDAAAAINAARAGVSAYVAAGANGARLVLKGQEGAANGFVVEAAESSAGTGLAHLAWQPGTGEPDRLALAAGDASFTLDGIAMTGASNTIRGAAPGLDLTLTGTNKGAPATIRLAEPGPAVSGMMADLASALNEVVGRLREATAPDGGELASDPGARALRSALSRLSTDAIIPHAPAGEPRTLSDLGLRTERDGSFAFDPARLAAVQARSPAGVAAMLTTGLHGIYATFDRLARAVGRTGDSGSLAGSAARYEKLATTTSAEASRLAEKQETLRLQLVRRFAGTDARVAASQSTLSFLKAQIDAWNAGKG